MHIRVYSDFLLSEGMYWSIFGFEKEEERRGRKRSEISLMITVDDDRDGKDAENIYHRKM